MCQSAPVRSVSRSAWRSRRSEAPAGAPTNRVNERARKGEKVFRTRVACDVRAARVERTICGAAVVARARKRPTEGKLSCVKNGAEGLRELARATRVDLAVFESASENASREEKKKTGPFFLSCRGRSLCFSLASFPEAKDPATF